MTKELLQQEAISFLDNGPENYVQPEAAMEPHLAGMRIYDPPLLGIAAADDPMFSLLRREDVVHPEHLLPEDVLPGARSVISFFLPFTQRVKDANAALPPNRPADEWLHARVEGQETLLAFGHSLCRLLAEDGQNAVMPAASPSFRMLGPYCPNWSERHVAHICALGTFGLSKGLITAKGVAGRLGSIVTDAAFPPDARPYDNPFAYCTMCGLCARSCPVRAIDPGRGVIEGKVHPPCERYLESMKRLPCRGDSGRKRYGCGKCQVGVPCQDKIPER